MKKNKLLPVILCMLAVALTMCKKNPKQGEQPQDLPVKEVRLGDSVKVNFPDGSIGIAKVTLQKASDPALWTAFSEIGQLYNVKDRLPYQLLLDIGPQNLKNDSVKITIKLPAGFIAQKPAAYGFELFARSYSENEFEAGDLFSLVISTYQPATGELSAYLPREFFTDQTNAGHSWQTTLIIATTPGTNLSTGGLALQAIPQPPFSECKVSAIACPLGNFELCSARMSSPYGFRSDPNHPGSIEFHRGVDYDVEVGTAVYSAADGTIEKAQTSVTYGNIVVVRHLDKSATLYAHLSKNNFFKAGSTVHKGDQIGLSGNTGSMSKKRHLHFGFYPSGQLYASKTEKDPYPCIVNGTVDGNITVRDNGNWADDAFEVYINNNFLGKTEIGAANTMAANNLRPGNATLKLTCTIAPDNEGTYEVILNNGLSFSDGTERRSGVMLPGQSLSWGIVIPLKTTSKSNVHLMAPSSVTEKRIQ